MDEYRLLRRFLDEDRVLCVMKTGQVALLSEAQLRTGRTGDGVGRFGFKPVGTGDSAEQAELVWRTAEQLEELPQSSIVGAALREV